jgi:AcrR family transcriptional regulator
MKLKSETVAGGNMGRKKSEGKSPERRAEIVGALYNCILKRGYQNTSVRDIAAEAGIQVGALYYYFENKDEILYSLSDYVFDKYKANFLRLTGEQSDRSPEDTLKEGLRFFFIDIAGDRGLVIVFQELMVLSHHDKKLRNSLQKFYKQYREEVAEFLLTCSGSSKLHDSDIQALAAFLVSASEGASDLSDLDPKGYRLPKMAEMAHHFIDCRVGQYDKV